MKLKHVVLGILFITIQWNYAQQIQGKVIDLDTKQPLAYVAVYIPHLSLGTTTLLNGNFSFKTSEALKENHRIQFSMLGYETQDIRWDTLKKQNFSVSLKRIYENLDEVVINSSKKLHPSIPFDQLADLPLKVGDAASVIINNKIYVFAGDKSFIEQPNRRIMEESTSFEQFLQRMRMDVSFEAYSDALQIYAIESDRWTVAPQKFRKRAFHKAVQIGKKVFVLGGKRLNFNRTAEILDHHIEVFHTQNNTLAIDKTNPHQAVNFAAVSYKDNIITMGGSTKVEKGGTVVYSKKAFVLNTKTGLWYRLPNMITPKETNGILVGNKIYTIGGYRNGPLTEIESFDLITGRWTLEGELFKGISRPVLAASGATIFIYKPGKLMVFDTLSKQLKEFDLNIFYKGISMQYSNNKLYLIGGFYSDTIAYTTKAVNTTYAINLADLIDTKIRNSKTLE